LIIGSPYKQEFGWVDFDKLRHKKGNLFRVWQGIYKTPITKPKKWLRIDSGASGAILIAITETSLNLHNIFILPAV